LIYNGKNCFLIVIKITNNPPPSSVKEEGYNVVIGNKWDILGQVYLELGLKKIHFL
jgi:hypothetical protein